MARRLLVTRFDVARALGVHVASVWLWSRHEGLADAALVHPGGPGRPALYNPAAVVTWFNSTKARPVEDPWTDRPTHWQPLTLEALRAAVTPTAPRRPRRRQRSAR